MKLIRFSLMFYFVCGLWFCKSSPRKTQDLSNPQKKSMTGENYSGKEIEAITKLQRQLKTKHKNTQKSRNIREIPADKAYTNYRHFKVTIDGFEITVAGMAHPANKKYNADDQSLETIFGNLEDANYDTLISLDTGNKEQVAKKWRGSHKVIGIEDFSVPTQDQYDDFYEYVKSNNIEKAIRYAQECTTKVVQKTGVATP